MKLRIASLSSGSAGNCIYVGNENQHILIDAGIPGKRVEQGLNGLGLTTGDIQAVFITHEHIDHIGGLGVLLRKHPVPVYATEGTLQGIRGTASLGKIPQDVFNTIKAEEDVRLGELEFHPMAVQHDSREPVAYRVNCGGKSAAAVTDLGTYDQKMIEELQGLNALLLETNHDVRMLELGPYPYATKQRILGSQGHLSNEAAGKFLCSLLNENMQHIILGHLSKENNYPALAYETIRSEITMGDNPYHSEDFNISVAPPAELSEIAVI